jgi:50S ribosomal subunit-associated GTPase HflX
MPVQHALLIKEALTLHPIKAICVLIPFNDRPDDTMIQHLEKTVNCLQSVPKFQEMTIVVITKFDQCEDESAEQAKQDITNIFAQYGYKKIIFSCKETAPDKLANEIYLQMKGMRCRRLEISEQDLIKNFKLYSMTRTQEKAFEACINKLD